MNDISQILSLCKTEFTLEFRNKYALGGILLFCVVIVFISFKAFNQFSAMTWNIMYWICLLFIGSTAVLKSFVQQSGQVSLYYYQLASPLVVIVAKLIYNFFFLSFLAFMIYGLFIYFSFDPVQSHKVFVANILLVCLGLAVVFSFVSALARGEKNASVLNVIMGLPMILPVLLMGIKIGANALGFLSDTSLQGDFLILAAIDLLLLGLVIILFPILWKS